MRDSQHQFILEDVKCNCTHVHEFFYYFGACCNNDIITSDFGGGGFFGSGSQGNINCSRFGSVSRAVSRCPHMLKGICQGQMWMFNIINESWKGISCVRTDGQIYFNRRYAHGCERAWQRVGRRPPIWSIHVFHLRYLWFYIHHWPWCSSCSGQLKFISSHVFKCILCYFTYFIGLDTHSFLKQLL